jgi:hypothetical protein
MVGGAVVFHEVVTTIGRTWVPVISELLLGVTIMQPSVLLYCFCASWQYAVGYDAKGNAVVCLNGRGGLFMTQFFEDHLAWYCLVCIDVERAKLGFGSRGHDRFDYLGGIQDSTIVETLLVPLEREKWPPAWLCTLGLLRYDALL